MSVLGQRRKREGMSCQGIGRGSRGARLDISGFGNGLRSRELEEEENHGCMFLALCAFMNETKKE